MPSSKLNGKAAVFWAAIAGLFVVLSLPSGSWAGPLLDVRTKSTDALKVESPTANISVIPLSGDGHLTVKMPTAASLRPSLNGCPEGTTITGTDSVGTIVIGPSGGWRCEVVFGTPFTEAPACFVSDNMAHPTPKRVSTSTERLQFDQVAAWDTVTNNFSGQVGTMLGGEKVNYICIGFTE